MKILYAVTGAEYGGAVVHVVGLMRADVKLGHTVGLISAPEPRLMSEAKSFGVQFFPNRFFIRRVKLLNDIRSIWPVFQAIRRFKPDIISAHSTKAGFAVRLCGALLGKPVIFTAHGWAFTEGRKPWKRKVLVLLERLAAKVTEKIICVSRHDIDLAIKFKVVSTGKLVLIHNGVEPSPFLKADSQDIKHELNIGKVPVLTMVGRLVSQKDPLTFLEACRFINQDYQAVIVGDGELREQIETFITQNQLDNKVILTGERKDVPEILAASDIFVLASNWEGLPLVIIEAEMAGLPVVASRVGGVAELVQDGTTGFTVPPRDARALAEALKKLIENAPLRQSLGRAGREKALNEFTFDRMLEKTHKVYEEVLGGKQAENSKS
jgi:glycosyltransferase involved in cell wall biosynthesis